MTLEEFFKFEEHSEIRHEYVDGAIFAMSGASVSHERIRHRLVMAFGNHLPGGPCQAAAEFRSIGLVLPLNAIYACVLI
jgi:Uma2 family endonuclease